MKYPSMNRGPKRSVNIPYLDGGINTRDTKSGIMDNQLCSAKNVWYKDGALRTRPCFKTNANMHQTFVASYQDEEFVFAKPHKDVVNGEKILMSSLNIREDDDKGGYLQTICTWWQGKENITYIAEVSVGSDDDTPINYFAVQKYNLIYLFVSTVRTNSYQYIYKHDINKTYTVLEDKWELVSDEERYAPVVITNSLRTGTGVMPEFTGDLIQGYNLISNYAKIVYSTINPNYSHSDKNQMQMIYLLPKLNEGATPASYYGYTVTAKHTTTSGTATHTVTLNEQGIGEESEVQSDGLKMRFVGRIITFKNSSNNIALINNDDPQILNNLEITFPHFSDSSKIFGCTFSEWYGGVSEGINGGTRLFVSGNSNNGSTVYWSDLNNPLYFPENNWFQVGTTGIRVTAFGKQNDKLIIFKDNETWYTQYTQTTSPTAEEVQNQSFNDLTTANAMFPLVLINDSIGCDCPNTVQLCRNRIVFTNSNGKVYEIITMSQYSENNIYEIGGMIENSLKTETNLKTATSVDFEGHYCIIVGQKMYLCDYNSYGFQYAYKFVNDDDSQVKIPWYVWELPISNGDCFTIGDLLLLGKNNSLTVGTEYQQKVLSYCTTTMDCDNNGNDEILVPSASGNNVVCNKEMREYESSFATKLFTFGAPNKRKNVEQVSIITGDNEGQKITISFVTEHGTETETYFANITECKTIFPYTKGTAKFGIQMSSSGKLTVEGITLLYRMLGVIR